MKKKQPFLFFLSGLVLLGSLYFALQKNQDSASLGSPLPVENSSKNTIPSLPNAPFESAHVTRVIDGDTIEVALNGQDKKVRLVGMDTPETVDPQKSVQCFGKEASDETKSLLTDKDILLQKDETDTDKYGRLLRFVFLNLGGGQTLFVDDYLVREGYARVLTISPNSGYEADLLAAEKSARENKKGLWGSCQVASS